MAFDTFPCNPYPISKGMLEKGNNDELNTRVTALEGEVSDLNDTKANQITIAPFFSAEASYEVGDLVYYNGLSYRCTNDHEGEWDADDFAATTVSGELATLKSGLTYHKVGESAATGTYADKLQSLNTAYSSLSLAQKLSAVLVLNGNNFYYPTNASGAFHTTDVSSNNTVHVSVSLAGTIYNNSNGTIYDNSTYEDASVFSIWVAN